MGYILLWLLGLPYSDHHHPCPSLSTEAFEATMVDTVVVEVPGQTGQSANVSGIIVGSHPRRGLCYRRHSPLYCSP